MKVDRIESVEGECTTFFKSSIPLTFTIDKTIPLDSNFVANFTKIAGVSYSLDGQNNVTIVGNTTLTDLPYAEHNVTVYAEDTLGNITVSQTIFFTTKAEPFPTTLLLGSIIAVIAVAGLGLAVHLKNAAGSRERA
jgi:hypothetical protein